MLFFLRTVSKFASAGCKSLSAFPPGPACISQLHHVDHRDREDLMDLGPVGAHLQMDPVRHEGAFESHKCHFICKEIG